MYSLKGFINAERLLVTYVPSAMISLPDVTASGTLTDAVDEFLGVTTGIIDFSEDVIFPMTAS